MNSSGPLIHGRRFVPYISRERIAEKVAELAGRISADYAGERPMLLVVLNGAMPFAIALMQQLTVEVELCCIRYASYVGTSSTGAGKEVIGLPEDRLRGRRVIVVEDIVDTGRTIAYLHERLQSCGVKDSEVAALTFKRGKYLGTLPIRYVGFEIDDAFVVGFGMDYDEYGRQYPDIYQLEE